MDALGHGQDKLLRETSERITAIRAHRYHVLAYVRWPRKELIVALNGAVAYVRYAQCARGDGGALLDNIQ